MAQSKRWVFTINNPEEGVEETIKAWECVYQSVGRETAPETGTPHLQGYIYFDKNKRLAAVKKLHATAHWEAAKGNVQQNKDYTQKDGNFWEVGDAPEDQRGADEKERWKRARDVAESGGDFADIPDDIYLRYYRTLKEIRKDFMAKAPDADGVTGVWYWGPPGTGKSRKAREEFPDSYLKMQNKWWDGYQGEESVILDDFDSKELGHHLKIWADRYAFIAETKGGAIQIRPKHFVITSNYSPADLWDDQVLVEAIRRRFKVTHFEAA